MSLFILNQVTIIFFSTLAKLTEDLLGLVKKDEYKVENISQALQRYLENTTYSVRAAQINMNLNEIEKE